MNTADDRAFASVLRERAMALYRKADFMPLRHGDDSMDRHAALKEKADRYMAEADELDPRDPATGARRPAEETP